MPNISVKIPQGAFDAAARADIATRLTRMAKNVEQIGDDPRQEFLTWVTIEEVGEGCFFTGGRDPLSRIIPVIVQAFLPAGVVDEAGRAAFVLGAHDAVAAAKSPTDPRAVTTSTIVCEVADGSWAPTARSGRFPFSHARPATNISSISSIGQYDDAPQTDRG